MGDALGDGADRPGAVQSAAADDEEVCAFGCLDQSVCGGLPAVLVLAVGDCCDEALVDALAAPGDERVQFGIEALGEVAGRGVGCGRLDGPVDADEDVAWESVLGWAG